LIQQFSFDFCNAVFQPLKPPFTVHKPGNLITIVKTRLCLKVCQSNQFPVPSNYEFSGNLKLWLIMSACTCEAKCHHIRNIRITFLSLWPGFSCYFNKLIFKR